MVPSDIFSHLTTKVDRNLEYEVDEQAEGFYQLVGYTGEMFSLEWTAFEKTVGHLNNKDANKLMDHFLFFKIEDHATNNENCVMELSSLQKVNVFIRLTPTYTQDEVDGWVTDDIVAHVKYWRRRTDFTEELENIKPKVKYFDFGSQNYEIKSLKPIGNEYNGRNLNLCFSPSIQQRYWDFDKGQWLKAIQQHNYKVMNPSDVSRTPSLVTSQSQMKKARENKQKMKDKNKLATKPSHSPPSPNRNKKRKRGHDDGEFEDGSSSMMVPQGGGTNSDNDIMENENDDRYVVINLIVFAIFGFIVVFVVILSN